jgi:hypothetical protein
MSDGVHFLTDINYQKAVYILQIGDAMVREGRFVRLPESVV